MAVCLEKVIICQHEWHLSKIKRKKCRKIKKQNNYFGLQEN